MCAYELHRRVCRVRIPRSPGTRISSWSSIDQENVRSSEGLGLGITGAGEMEIHIPEKGVELNPRAASFVRHPLLSDERLVAGRSLSSAKSSPVVTTSPDLDGEGPRGGLGGRAAAEPRTEDGREPGLLGSPRSPPPTNSGKTPDESSAPLQLATTPAPTDGDHRELPSIDGGTPLETGPSPPHRLNTPLDTDEPLRYGRRSPDHLQFGCEQFDELLRYNRRSPERLQISNKSSTITTHQPSPPSINIQKRTEITCHDCGHAFKDMVLFLLHERALSSRARIPCRYCWQTCCSPCEYSMHWRICSRRRENGFTLTDNEALSALEEPEGVESSGCGDDRRAVSATSAAVENERSGSASQVELSACNNSGRLEDDSSAMDSAVPSAREESRGIERAGCMDAELALSAELVSTENGHEESAISLEILTQSQPNIHVTLEPESKENKVLDVELPSANQLSARNETSGLSGKEQSILAMPLESLILDDRNIATTSNPLPKDKTDQLSTKRDTLGLPMNEESELAISLDFVIPEKRNSLSIPDSPLRLDMPVENTKSTQGLDNDEQPATPPIMGQRFSMHCIDSSATAQLPAERDSSGLGAPSVLALSSESSMTSEMNIIPIPELTSEQLSAENRKSIQPSSLVGRPITLTTTGQEPSMQRIFSTCAMPCVPPPLGHQSAPFLSAQKEGTAISDPSLVGETDSLQNSTVAPGTAANGQSGPLPGQSSGSLGTLTPAHAANRSKLLETRFPTYALKAPPELAPKDPTPPRASLLFSPIPPRKQAKGTDSSKGPGIFTCSTCGYIFTSESGFTKHMQLHNVGQHTKAMGKAVNSLRNVTPPEMLPPKLESKTTGPYYWCLSCAATYQNPSDFAIHLERCTISPVNKTTCRFCKRFFGSPSARANHEEHCKPVLCLGRNCMRSFRAFGGMSTHLESGSCASGMSEETLCRILLGSNILLNHIYIHGKNYTVNPHRNFHNQLLTSSPADHFTPNGSKLKKLPISHFSTKKSLTCSCGKTFLKRMDMNQHKRSARTAGPRYFCDGRAGCKPHFLRRFFRIGGLVAHLAATSCGGDVEVQEALLRGVLDEAEGLFDVGYTDREDRYDG